MNNAGLLKNFVIPILIVSIVWLLQLAFISINNFFFILSFVFFYLLILKTPSTALLIFLFFVSLSIDNIHSLALGTCGLIIFTYAIFINLQNKYLKTTNFVFSYLFFIAINLLVALLGFIINIDVLSTSFNNIIMFLLVIIFCYPVFYTIISLFYNKYE